MSSLASFSAQRGRKGSEFKGKAFFSASEITLPLRRVTSADSTLFVEEALSLVATSVTGKEDVNDDDTKAEEDAEEEEEEEEDDEEDDDDDKGLSRQSFLTLPSPDLFLTSSPIPSLLEITLGVGAELKTC